MFAKAIFITLLCTRALLAVDTTQAPTTTAGPTGTGTTVAVTGTTGAVTGSTGATTLAGCIDVEPDCAQYVSTLCVKPVYAQVMYSQCKKTCGMCNGNNAAPCVDAHNNCLSWNKLNYCASSFYSAQAKKTNCAKTCGLCDSTTGTTVAGCVDKNNNCAAWDTKGYCASTAYTDAAKKTNCAKTCKMC